MFEKSPHIFSLTIISSSTPQTAEPTGFAIFVATLKTQAKMHKIKQTNQQIKTDKNRQINR